MIKIKYQAHVAGEGWQDEVYNGQIAGTVGQNKAIEAIRITGIEGLDEGVNLGVVLQAHVQDYGWVDEVTNSMDCGSTGLGKHLEAIKINVFGENASEYEIWYRLHVQDKGFLGWVRNGEPSGTEGGNIQAEAIQIFLRKKNENFWMASDTTIPFEKIEKEIAPPQPQEESADSKRKRVIDMAASHVGESGTEFQARMGIPGQDWCAAFVSCIFIDCGLRNLIPITVSVPTAQGWAKNNGTWRSVNSGYTPKSGDLVIYDFNSNGTGDHIGIVHSVPNNNTIFAVEGNTGSPRLVRMQGRTSGIIGYIAVGY